MTPAPTAAALAEAVRAWDASLSSYCDGPERDAVRAALLEFSRSPAPAEVREDIRAAVEAGVREAFADAAEFVRLASETTDVDRIVSQLRTAANGANAAVVERALARIGGGA